MGYTPTVPCPSCCSIEERKGDQIPITKNKNPKKPKDSFQLVKAPKINDTSLLLFRHYTIRDWVNKVNTNNKSPKTIKGDNLLY